ncbi:CAP domain-containing protein [Bartonella sp. LJL80]
MLTRRHFVLLTGAVMAQSALSIPAFAASDDAASLLNAIRAEHGLTPLSPDSQLEKMAQHQANLMADKGKVSHSVGWGNGFVARLRKFGIRGAAGENLCAGQKDIASAYKAWMNSPGHRRNMLDPEFGHFGLAKASTPQKPNYIYWAIVFGR